MSKLKPAVAYTRVSSAEQLREGFSIAAQQVLLRDYAKRNGYEIVAEFSDDETAKTTGRPDFGRMLQHLRANPGHTIIAEKTDRLYRNLKDYQTLDELGVEIHFAKEGGRLATNADAKFMHGIRVLMAKKYVDNLSEEVKKGMVQKAREGGWPTWAPIGYMNVKDSAEKKRTGGIIPDPVKAPLVRNLFEAAATGEYSLGDLRVMAKVSGLRGRHGAPLAKSNVRYILTNVMYAGRVVWGGATYQGRYEPLVTEELFEATQRALRSGSRPKTRKHVFTFAGLVRCGTCDGVLTGDRKKGRYVYYACRGAADCKQFYREEVFDDRVVGILRSLVIDDAVSDWIVGEMGRWYDEVGGKALSAITSHHRRLAELKNLEASSYEDKLLGKLDESTWRALNAKWKAEAEELRRAIAAAQPTISREAFLEAARRPFELVKAAADQYVAQKAEEKARLLRVICSNFTVIDGNVYVSMRSPFDVMLESPDRTTWLARLDDYRTRLDAYIAAIIAA